MPQATATAGGSQSDAAAAASLLDLRVLQGRVLIPSEHARLPLVAERAHALGTEPADPTFASQPSVTCSDEFDGDFCGRQLPALVQTINDRCMVYYEVLFISIII